MSSLPRTLVVFHSRTGHTRRIARMLAGRLDAEVEEIGFAARRTPGCAQCAVQALAGCAAAIRPTQHDPAQYDIVLVGTPVWFWSLPSPVRGWLKRHRLGNAQVAFFCTMGGSGAARVFAQMRAACGKAPRATLELTEAQLAAGPLAAFDAFAARVAGASARHAASRPPATAAAEAAAATPAPRAPLPRQAPRDDRQHPRAHSRDAHGTHGTG